MKKIDVLIVDDSELQCRVLTRQLAEYEGLRVVGAARDGVEALQMVIQLRPQVMVLDIVIPRLDGYGLIEQIQRITDIPHPAIIVLSSMGREDFLLRAMNACVNYYMLKPADPQQLAQHIIEAAGGTIPADGPQLRARSCEEMVRDILLQLHVPANLEGYRCLRTALMESCGEAACLQSLSRSLYPRVAQRHGLSEKSVERAIRHAINQAWIRGGAEMYRQLLGRQGSIVGDRPTNGEFLAQVTECLRLRMRLAEKNP